MKFIADYEHALAQQARKRGADGVVCGHIHKAEIRVFDGIGYYNTGDWVESCTALVEDYDGRLDIVRWPAVEESQKGGPVNAPSRTSAGIRFVLLVGWILLLAFLFAQAEIQIEGPHGWASSLPTWRIVDSHVLKFLFGGRQITGYHVFIFAFMFAVFHLPCALTGAFSLQLEARILGSLMAFWIVEDVLWFILNPAYGLSKLTPHDAPWHPCWCLGMPIDYPVFMGVGALLLAYSFRSRHATGVSAAEEARNATGDES